MAGIWVFSERAKDSGTAERRSSLANDLGVNLTAFAQTEELAREYAGYGAHMCFCFNLWNRNSRLNLTSPFLCRPQSRKTPTCF